MDPESKRSKFTPEEINRLLPLIEEHIDEIEGTAPISKLERALVWGKIHTIYNFRQNKTRTLKMLKSKWSDLKIKAKSEKMEDYVLRGKVLNIMNKLKKEVVSNNTQKKIANAGNEEIYSVSSKSDSSASTSSPTVQAKSFNFKKGTGASERPLEEDANTEITKQRKMENENNVNLNNNKMQIELLMKIKEHILNLQQDVEKVLKTMSETANFNEKN